MSHDNNKELELKMFTDLDRGKLSLLVTELFDKWQLNDLESLSLLGLSAKSRSILYKYKKGYPLSASRDRIERVGMLLSIHKSLGILYPNNPAVSHSWIKMNNQLLSGVSPLNLMIQKGYFGILKIYWLLQTTQTQ